MLRWARERAGLSVAEVAGKLKRDKETVAAWEESGEDAPTYSQLEKLAYQLYKRPLAIFFFPEPPDEPDPSSAFRTLPEPEIEELGPDVRYAVREAAAMQLTLAELNDGVNPSERKIFTDVDAPASAPHAAASKTRAYLGIQLPEQLGWKSADEALKNWRTVVQERGIFVFKRSFATDDVSGFSLMHDQFPLIYLHNGSSARRQIFTLFHELGHILLESSGVTKIDDSYIESLKGYPRRVEVFCNQFAGEFLVPTKDLVPRLSGAPLDETHISELADRYWVSREVILRKYLDRGLVTPEYYRERADEWNEEYHAYKLNAKAKSKGGNYYATQATYLGEHFLRTVFRKYYDGQFGREQLADYLNMKESSIAGLEQFLENKAAG